MHTWNCANCLSSPTEEVIINILERLQQFRGMQPKVKKPVLSLLGELVYYEVPRRQRIRRGVLLVVLLPFDFDSP